MALVTAQTTTGTSVQVEPDCTITAPDGAEYTSGGAFVSDSLIIAYTKDREPMSGGNGVVQGGTLTTWHGEKIGTFVVTGLWQQIAPVGWANWYTMRSISATINGKRWHGRQNTDGGNYVKLHPYKHQDA